jgi:hypothetical protein
LDGKMCISLQLSLSSGLSIISLRSLAVAVHFLPGSKCNAIVGTWYPEDTI